MKNAQISSHIATLKRCEEIVRFLFKVVLTIIAIIVSLLIEYIKNDRPSPKVHGHL